MSQQRDLTQLLRAATAGDAAASDELIELVYADLYRNARQLMRKERAGHTLQPTVLVHDAFMRLVRGARVEWQGRAHFFTVASNQMRRILVSHARKRNAARRGGGAPRLSFDEGLGLSTENDADVLTLNEALEALEILDARMAQVVVMRFFGGLTISEVAAVLAVSKRTVENDWAMARAWLRHQITSR